MYGRVGEVRFMGCVARREEVKYCGRIWGEVAHCVGMLYDAMAERSVVLVGERAMTAGVVGGKSTPTERWVAVVADVETLIGTCAGYYKGWRIFSENVVGGRDGGCTKHDVFWLNAVFLREVLCAVKKDSPCDACVHHGTLVNEQDQIPVACLKNHRPSAFQV